MPSHDPEEPPTDPDDDAPPRFAEALRFWVKLGFISFGGPAGQIAMMHAELVERKRWISERRFLEALNFCMLLPGPEAQQLATYCGWRLHRAKGAFAAGILFVLPGALVLWLLSFLYFAYGGAGAMAAAFEGLKPVVLAIVAGALLKIGRKTLRGPWRWALAGAAFVAIFFLGVPFPAIIGAAALAGWLATRRNRGSGRAQEESRAEAVRIGDHARPAGWGRSLAILALGLVLWWAPVWISARSLGVDHVLTQEGVFFSKAAMVTFGGAYAVLPYVAQRAVEDHDWVSAGQMLDGLGLAETTPGPLILVLQFVGFGGAWQSPAPFPPLLAGTLGALMTTWVTFAPCFLWIFLGAPHIERLNRYPAAKGAMDAITAAVVGVILNLSAWFGLQVLFPEGEVAWFSLIVGAAALFALLRWRCDPLWLVAAGCALGLVRWWAGVGEF